MNESMPISMNYFKKYEVWELMVTKYVSQAKETFIRNLVKINSIV